MNDTRTSYTTGGKYRRHMSILLVLDGVIRRHNAGKRSGRKTYCYPSQETIRELLARYHGVRCSRRTINRDLRELEDGTSPLGKGITRIRRHRKGANGMMVMHSTAYYIAKQAVAKLFRQAKRLQTLIFSRVPSLAQYMHKVHKDLTESAPACGMGPLSSSVGGVSPPSFSP